MTYLRDFKCNSRFCQALMAYLQYRKGIINEKDIITFITQYCRPG